MLTYVKNQRITLLVILNWKNIPHLFVDNFTKCKKKSLLNLEKAWQYKVSQTFGLIKFNLAKILEYKITLNTNSFKLLK